MYQRAMTFRLDGVGWFHVVIGEAHWDVYEVAGVSLTPATHPTHHRAT